MGQLKQMSNTLVRKCRVLLCEKVHQIARGSGIRSEGRPHNMASGVAPVLAEVMGTISAQGSCNGLTKDNLTCVGQNKHSAHKELIPLYIDVWTFISIV